MALKQFEKEITQAAFRFEQITRSKAAAIYRKTFRLSGLCCGYAVFRIKEHEGKEITGDYYTVYTLLEAQEQYQRLVKNTS